MARRRSKEIREFSKSVRDERSNHRSKKAAYESAEERHLEREGRRAYTNYGSYRSAESQRKKRG